MLSLAHFPPPHLCGEVTICEYDCNIYSSECSQASIPLPNDLQHFPTLKIPPEMLKLCESKENCAKSAFLSGTVTASGKLMNAWHEHGLVGVLEELSQLQEDNYYLLKASRGLSAMIRFMYSLHWSLYPHIRLSNEDMVAEFSTSSAWRKSVIRCLAWHPFMNKCAVALHDDSIFIETYGSSVKPILKYRTQKNIADIAWRPYSSSQLAVASQSNILIWTIDPSSLFSRPSSSCVQVLSLNGHGPATSIAWSPNDGSFLLSGSPADPTMVLWCVATEEHVPLRQFGSGVSLIRWSPDGRNVLSATPSSFLRIWNTEKWTYERWSNLEGRCQAACWSPDGTDLLFSLTNQNSLFHLSLNGSKSALPLVDVSEIEYLQDNRTVRAGGKIEQMVWNNSGERLAISFKGEKDQCGLIAVFRTKTKPSMEIFSCGYIQGPENTFPCCMAFKPSYERGALLTVCWSNGEISHIPFIFMKTPSISSNSSIQQDDSKSFLSPLRKRSIYSD